ncbi:MAG: hypothetical protein HUJ98_13945, partial [Bacteroidaceae bacterium]|nr:hypothetical protein [Bacteroidaceae bacterium]
SYNNGQVNGKENVGGLIGYLTSDEVIIENAYNTNESSPLSTSSQIWVGEDGLIDDVGGGYLHTVSVNGNSYYSNGAKVELTDGQQIKIELDLQGKLTGKYYIADKDGYPIRPEGQPEGKVYVTPITQLINESGQPVILENFVPGKGENYTTVSKFGKPCLVDKDTGAFITYTDLQGKTHYLFEATTYEWKDGSKALNNYFISDADVLSKYGKITGEENVGGLVGKMDAGHIYESYNAGNVTGGTNVGGLVGQMDGGEVKSAYNADNNTVIRESKEAPGNIKTQAPVWQTVGDTEQYYQYRAVETEYNSFFTVDDSGNRTYYWFLPNNGATVRGAAGVYVGADGEIVENIDTLIPEDKRYYFNRVAYKDANVTGNTNVGGLVGQMTSGTVDNSYNAGTVKKTGDEAENHGALVGDFKKTLTGTEKEKVLPTITDSFFVSGENKGIIVGPAAT